MTSLTRVSEGADALAKGAYVIVSLLVGVVTFVGAWIYAISTSGFLLGVGLGWLPAAIVAVVAALLWPVAAFLLAWLYWQ